jgi:hypothetical protein
LSNVQHFFLTHTRCLTFNSTSRNTDERDFFLSNAQNIENLSATQYHNENELLKDEITRLTEQYHGVSEKLTAVTEQYHGVSEK